MPIQIPQFRPTAGDFNLGNAISDAMLAYNQAKTQKAELAQQAAQTELFRQRAKSEEFKQKHPGYLGGVQSQMLQWLQDQNALGGVDASRGLQGPAQLGAIQQSEPLGESVPARGQQLTPEILTESLTANTNRTTPKVSEEVKIYEPEEIGDHIEDLVKSSFDMQGLDKLKFKGPMGAVAESMIKAPYMRMQLQELQRRASPWTHATENMKNYMVAQLSGMGVDQATAAQLFANGLTIPQIARSLGYDPKNLPAPDFAPTQGNITTLKNRQAALKEAKVIDKFVAEGLAPYSRKIFGYSPVQIGEALAGTNPEGQAKFLAARALAPEAATIRLMLANGKVGISAIRELTNKSMQNVKTFEGLVDENVYSKAQDLITENLEKSFNKAEEAYRTGKKKTAPTKNSMSPLSGIVNFKTPRPTGKSDEIYEAKVPARNDEEAEIIWDVDKGWIK